MGVLPTLAGLAMAYLAMQPDIGLASGQGAAHFWHLSLCV